MAHVTYAFGPESWRADIRSLVLLTKQDGYSKHTVAVQWAVFRESKGGLLMQGEVGSPLYAVNVF